MPNPGLSKEIKEAIAVMLVAGKSPNEIVSELKVSHSSVSRTKASLPPDVLAKMTEEDQAMVLDLVNTSLIEGLNATIAISKQFQDLDYIKAQPANQLAIAYGVVSDKSVRLLEAAENAALASAAEKGAEYLDNTREEDNVN